MEFRWACDVVKLMGDNGVEAIRIRDKETGTTDLACYGVFVFIGLAPNSGLCSRPALSDPEIRAG